MDEPCTVRIIRDRVDMRDCSTAARDYGREGSNVGIGIAEKQYKRCTRRQRYKVLIDAILDKPVAWASTLEGGQDVWAIGRVDTLLSIHAGD